MPAPDIGHQDTDKELARLLRRIRKSYSTAIAELQKKINDYMEQFEKQDAYYRALFDSGEMTYNDFIKWRRTAVMDTKQWKDMRDQLAFDMTHQNEIAASMINDTLPEVYAINHNFGTYEAEVGSGIDTTYTLYDRFTAARLMKDTEYVLPTVNEPKDKAWNKQLIQSSVLQGILQGEPMKDIAGRFERVVGMTESAAMRNARTAVTGAENAGRVDSYLRAEKMGIGMKQVWMATLDGRTRDSHAAMDGEMVAPGKEFSNKCKYPGDPNGAPGEIYNCRCTLAAQVEGADEYDPSDRPSEYLKKQGLTYEEWKEMHRQNMEKPESENKIEFIPAKTRQEAEDFAMKFAKNVDYKGISLENANKINETLLRLSQKYPINQLEILGGGTLGNAVAFANHHLLQINGKKLGIILTKEQEEFETKQKETQKMIDVIKSRYPHKIPASMQSRINKLENQLKFNRYGVHSSYQDHVSDIITHEYGHVLSDQYFGMVSDVKGNPNYTLNWRLPEMNKKWENAFLKSIQTGDIYNLSEYGSKNYREFFAESFLAREKGESLPDYVEELFKEVFNNGIM